MSQTALTSFVDLFDDLAVFVKYSAWVNTVPDKGKVPRRQLKEPAYPKVVNGGYLLEILFEAGPVKIAGMASQVAIDEMDLTAWQMNQQIALSPWECKTIRMLSREYAAMLSEAVNPNCPSPYLPRLEITAEQKNHIGNSMADWADKFNAMHKA